jgi:DNA-binding transcriptional LysR family regulator
VAPPPAGEDVPGVRHLALGDPGGVRTIGLVWAAERTRPPVVEGFRAFVLDRGGELAGAS